MLVVSLRRCELKLLKKTVNHSWEPCMYLLLYRRSKVLPGNTLSKSCASCYSDDDENGNTPRNRWYSH
jgi:hypothetical protein